MLKYTCQAEAEEAFRQAAKSGKPITGEMVQAAFTRGGSLPKDLMLMHWQQLEPDQPVTPLMEPLDAKAPGSTYGTDSIRIGGSPAFIDAVLSRLKDLLELENGQTRLAVSRSKVRPKEIGGTVKGFGNAAKDAECVYIHARERGREAQIAYAIVGLGGRTDKKEAPCAHTSPLFE